MTVVTNQNLGDVEFIPPDGGWGWIVVFSSLIIHFVMDGITYSLGTYLPDFVEIFKVSRSEASIVHALLPAITLSCGPIGSMLTNRFGCRKTCVYGAIIASLGFLLSYFAHQFFILYITIGLVAGVGFGIIYVPAIVSVGYYFEKKRSLAIGIAVCGSGIGTFVLSPINRILINQFGIQKAFLIKAVVILSLVLFGLLIKPVPIEPSEINKRKKYLKTAKKNSDEQKKLMNEKVNDKSGNYLEPVQNASDNLNVYEKDLAITNSKSDIRAVNNSALDLMAHVRSLQNVAGSKSKSLNALSLNDDDEEKTLMDKIKGFFDFTLLTNPVFIFFAISNFFTSLGFNAPYIFIVDQAFSVGIPTAKGDYFLSTIGISNTVGRIVLGLISDIKGVNRLFLYASVLTICGIATCIEPFFTTQTGFLVYSIVFGFTSGGYVSLTSVLLVDLLGLDKLTNAFGMLLVFQGVATAIGPPFIGFLFEQLKSYTIPFIFIGIVIGISGFMCFFIPCFKKKEESK